MKLLLFLHLPDPNITNKKIKASELAKIEAQLQKELFIEFKKQIKDNKSIKIIEEIPDSFRPQVIIECPDDYRSDAYHYFRDIKTVKTVDSELPRKNDKVESNPPSGKKILSITDLKRLSK